MCFVFFIDLYIYIYVYLHFRCHFLFLFVSLFFLSFVFWNCVLVVEQVAVEWKGYGGCSGGGALAPGAGG